MNYMSNQSRFERIGKYITLIKNEEATKTILSSWFDLCVVLAKEEKLDVSKLEDDWDFYPSDFDFSLIPIPSSIQVKGDLSAIQWACCEYGDKYDKEAYYNVGKLIKKIEDTIEYKNMKRYENRVTI